MILRSLLVLLLSSPLLAQTPTPATSPATPATSQMPANQTSAKPPATDLPDSPSAAAQIQPPVIPTGPTAVIDTSLGRLTCKLYDKQAPVTVANFIGLADGTKDWTDPITLRKIHGQPFYSGTTFHRVIPNFMIQGGDRVGNGTGDPGYFFKDEIDPTLTFDVPGRLAMANAGPATNGSQFFITEAPVPELDGKHTIFGQCDTHSVLLAASIARVDRDPSDKPVTPVVIGKITIVREGQPMPPAPAAPAASPSTSTPPAAPTPR